jgi:aldehyde:ferredoxin oxidoreductase
MENIAHRTNKTTKLLGEGVHNAAKALNAEEIAVHCKGMDFPGYDPRGVFGMGLAYATSDRGACHQRAWIVNAELKDPDLERFSFENKAKVVKDVQDERAAFFSLVLCDFAPISEEDCVEMWNLATGFDHSVETYLKCGERIWNIIRLFNIREGLKPGDDKLPQRVYKDAFSIGAAKGVLPKKSDFEKSLKEYYTLRGWSSDGVPSKEKLKQLNLSKS